MNRELKTDFRFLGQKKDRTVDCDAIYCCVFLCVSVNSCCVLVYMLTHVHECFIGNFNIILSTPIRKN